MQKFSFISTTFVRIVLYCIVLCCIVLYCIDYIVRRSDSDSVAWNDVVALSNELQIYGKKRS